MRETTWIIDAQSGELTFKFQILRLFLEEIRKGLIQIQRRSGYAIPCFPPARLREFEKNV